MSPVERLPLAAPVGATAPMALATTDDVSPYLPSGSGVRPENVPLLGRLVAAASKTLINRTGRNFAVEPAADTDPPVSKTFVVPRMGQVRLPDLRTATSVTFQGMALTEMLNYELLRMPGDDDPAVFLDLLPGSFGIIDFDVVRSPYVLQRPQITIVGTWGITPVPDELNYACCALAARMFSKKDARWADSVQASMESAAFNYYKDMPSDIKSIVESWRVKKVGVV